MSKEAVFFFRCEIPVAQEGTICGYAPQYVKLRVEYEGEPPSLKTARMVVANELGIGVERVFKATRKEYNEAKCYAIV